MNMRPERANLMTAVVSLVSGGVCLAMAYLVDDTVQAVILYVATILAALNALWASRRGLR